MDDFSGQAFVVGVAGVCLMLAGLVMAVLGLIFRRVERSLPPEEGANRPSSVGKIGLLVFLGGCVLLGVAKVASP